MYNVRNNAIRYNGLSLYYKSRWCNDGRDRRGPGQARKMSQTESIERSRKISGTEMGKSWDEAKQSL